jgi:hypothetical protein
MSPIKLHLPPSNPQLMPAILQEQYFHAEINVPVVWTNIYFVISTKQACEIFTSASVIKMHGNVVVEFGTLTS